VWFNQFSKEDNPNRAGGDIDINAAEFTLENITNEQERTVGVDPSDGRVESEPGTIATSLVCAATRIAEEDECEDR